jgi:hypothetical protein
VKPACLTAVTLLLAAIASGSAVRVAAAQSCDSVNDASLREADTQANAYIAKSWISRGQDWITAYDTPEVRRNPFATEKDASGAPASHGQIWARDISCIITDDPATGLVKLTYTAAVFRFSEEGKSWTRPQKNGVLIALELRLKDGQWSVTDRSADLSVLLPEDVLRLPKPEEIPDQAAWPDKRCRSPRHWEGKICAENPKDIHKP